MKMSIPAPARLLALLLLPALALSAQAREEIQDFSVSEALGTESAQEKLSDQVKFFFGGESYPEPKSSQGTFRTNKKTNAFNKSDKEACQWAFLSAMLALEERALREGGNAVVDIQSNYDNVLSSSDSSFKCGAGNIMAGVALQGRVVTLP